MELKLSIEKLTKNYKNKVALDGVDIEFTEGIYGLLGPNGAGKSTLMNIVAGLLKSTSGTVTFNGEAVYKNKPYQRLIGYMPQQQGYYPQFSGYRFLSYIAAVKGIKRNRIHDEVLNVAKKVMLTDALNKKVGSYSGGMRQRLLIAATMLDDPKILLLDEPTAGLDPKIRVEIRNLISDIAKEKIIIIATHVVSDVEFIANKIVVLKDGKIIACDDATGLAESIRGKVYTTILCDEELDAVKENNIVCSLNRTLDGINVRFLSDEKITEETGAEPVSPTLEDYYLYVFK